MALGRRLRKSLDTGPVAVPSYWAVQGIENRSGFLEGKIMKIRLAVAMAATLFAGALAMAADGSWTGYISDSQCGVKGANDKAGECTTKCVKEHGAKYVFVNDADKKVYAIDAQDKVAAHAGHHVTVKGTVDGENLKLTSIDMAAAAK
jgi:hypothetical protein